MDKQLAVGMRTTEFHCSGCGRTLQIAEKYVGSAGRCKFCEARIHIQVDSATEIERLFYGLPDAVAEAVKRAVRQGAAERRAAEEIAVGLDMVKELDAARTKIWDEHQQSLFLVSAQPMEMKEKLDALRAKLLEDYRNDIARVFLHYIQNELAYHNAREQGALWKWWTTAADDNVLPMCAMNEAAGWTAMTAPYPTGHQYPPGHLEGCRCTAQYRKAPPDEEILRRTSAHIARSKSAAAVRSK